MIASHFFVCRSARSAICLSSFPPASTMVNSRISGCSFASALMVVKPVTRQGLSVEALEKQICHLTPGLAYLLVSTGDGWIICSHGVAGSPCGAIRRWAIWRSKSAWLKYFDWVALVDALGAALGWLMIGLPPQAVAASVTAVSAAPNAAPRIVIGTPFRNRFGVNVPAPPVGGWGTSL